MTDKRFNDLIRQLKSKSAFDALYVWYYPKIVNHIRCKFGSKTLGEDVAQSFFLKLLGRKDTPYVKNPTAWVYTVCDNIAKDFLADEKRYDAAYTRREQTYSDDALERLLYDEYKQLIDRLDDDSGKIIVMHFYEGYSLREVAEIMGVNYGTVRQKCSRALKKLRKALKK